MADARRSTVSRRVTIVEELFALLGTQGVDAVLAATPPDVLWAPLGAAGRRYVGAELRDHFDALRAAGATHTSRMHEVQEHEEAVVVRGSVQVRSRAAQHDFQPTWVCRFDGEVLRSVTGYPTCREALASLERAGEA